MSLKITKPGILDTIQDLGRPGHRHLGVGPGGAVDARSARIVNLLVGNEEDFPVIETHFPAAAIEVRSDAVIAIGGAHFRPQVNGDPCPLWTSVRVVAGDSLIFGGRAHGSRAYIAVAGGFEAEEWLGSKSTNLFTGRGGFTGRNLRKDDELVFADPKRAAAAESGISAGRSLTDPYLRDPFLRVVEGPEADMLDESSKTAFFEEGFVVGAESNRMGIRMKGPILKTATETDLVSSAVAPGVVQLLPDGHPVVLGADCQTTGGYPRIARVISADLPIAGQAAPGDKVFFRQVTMEEAYEAGCDEERHLSFLRLGLRFRSFGKHTGK